MNRSCKTLLTIAIPTYNRAQPLLRTLMALLPQITSEVELIVLDNCSDTPCLDIYEEAARDFPHDRELVRVIRHSSNLGMQANILRCFELAECPWIWVLSDDDDPSPDAIATAVKAIHTAPSETIAINFASSIGPRTDTLEAEGADDFLEKIDYFGNFLFISSNLYRTAPMRKQLRFGYTYAYTQVSFFAMFLLGLGSEARVIFESKKLVNFSPPSEGNQKWSSITLMLGISCLLELPLNVSSSAYKAFEKNIMSMIISPRALLRIVIAKNRNHDPVVRRIFDQCYLRSYLSSPIVRRPLLKFFLCRIILSMPHSLQTSLLKYLGDVDDPTINSDIGTTRLERF